MSIAPRAAIFWTTAKISLGFIVAMGILPANRNFPKAISKATVQPAE